MSSLPVGNGTNGETELHDQLLPQDRNFATKATHVGAEPEQWDSLAVVPPIVLATTFKQDAPGQPREYEYGRSGNPTRCSLEKCLASLEMAEHALVYGSGLAATANLMALLSVGDHVVAMDDLYGGTNRMFRKITARQGIVVDFVDLTNVSQTIEAVEERTKMVWIETPTNPMLKLVDIRAVALAVKAKKSDVIIVVDNTFMSSYFQKPLTLGADVVVHSCSKYLNGHSDVIMGAIMVSRQDIHSELRFLQNAMGCVTSPFDCYLVARSLRTLALRMKQHEKNGLAVARFLEQHPAVEKVIHPGLKSHPQHHLAMTQLQGYSGMVSFYIKGGLAEASEFLKAIKLVTLAESLGGYESLAELPAVMTHASVPEEQRKQLGVTDNLIRMSVGIEETDDIIADLAQALKVATASRQ